MACYRLPNRVSAEGVCEQYQRRVGNRRVFSGCLPCGPYRHIPHPRIQKLGYRLAHGSATNGRISASSFGNLYPRCGVASQFGSQSQVLCTHPKPDNGSAPEYRHAKDKETDSVLNPGKAVHAITQMTVANADALRHSRPLFTQQQSPDTECQGAQKRHDEGCGHALFWRIAAKGQPASSIAAKA